MSSVVWNVVYFDCQKTAATQSASGIILNFYYNQSWQMFVLTSVVAKIFDNEQNIRIIS